MPAPPAQERYRVLIVDDDQEARDILGEILELDGFELNVAVDGADGVRKAAEVRPHVVILDIEMPIMTGIEAATVLRHQRLPVVLIALTGNTSPDLRRQAKDAGFDALLYKPADAAHITELARRLCREAQ